MTGSGVLMVLVIGLAVGCASVLSAMSGWNRAMIATRSPRQVGMGMPIWWIHAAAICWMASGVTLLYKGLVHEAGMAFVACLTTSIPTAFYLLGRIEQSG